MEAFLGRTETLWLGNGDIKTPTQQCFKYTFDRYVVVHLGIYKSPKQHYLKIEDRFQYDSVNYNLVGIILHEGDTTESGHYVSCVQCQEGWFLCDDFDASPESLTFDEIQKRITEKKFDPYFLFFQRGNIKLNPMSPKVVGQWKNNNCFIDATIQVLFNLYDDIPGNLKEHYDAYKKTDGENYDGIESIYESYRNDFYESRETSQEDPLPMVTGLINNNLKFRIKEKIERSNSGNSLQLLMVNWFYIRNEWPKDLPDAPTHDYSDYSKIWEEKVKEADKADKLLHRDGMFISKEKSFFFEEFDKIFQPLQQNTNDSNVIRDSFRKDVLKAAIALI